MPLSVQSRMRLVERLFYLHLVACNSDRKDLVKDLEKYALAYPYAIAYLINELVGSRNYHGQFIAYRLNKNLGYLWQKSIFGSGSRIYNQLMQCSAMIDQAILSKAPTCVELTPRQLAESAYDRGEYKEAVYGFKQAYSMADTPTEKNYIAIILHRSAHQYIDQALFDYSSCELKSYLEFAKECHQQKAAKLGLDEKIDQSLIQKMLDLAKQLDALHVLIVELIAVFAGHRLSCEYLDGFARHLQSMEVYLLLDFIGREIHHQRAGTAAIMADEFCYALDEGFSPVDCLYAIANHMYSPGQNGWRWNQPKMVEREFVVALEHGGRQRSSARGESFPISLARELRVRAFCVIHEWVLKHTLCLKNYDRAHFKEVLVALIPEYTECKDSYQMQRVYYHACCSILNVLNTDQLDTIVAGVSHLNKVMGLVSSSDDMQGLQTISEAIDNFLAQFPADQHAVFNRKIIQRCYLSATIELADKHKLRAPLSEANLQLAHYVCHHHREPYTRVGLAILSRAIKTSDVSYTVGEREIDQVLYHLASANTEGDIKTQLEKFCRLLTRSSYKLYGGGETIFFNHQTIKVPRHVKLMLETYQLEIQSASSLEALKALRDKIIGIAAYAADHPPSYFCGLFTPRDQETQALYDGIKSTAPHIR